MTRNTNTASSSSLIARDGVIVCGAIHGPLSAKECASNGCKGCRRHLRMMAEKATNPVEALDAITLVW